MRFINISNNRILSVLIIKRETSKVKILIFYKYKSNVVMKNSSIQLSVEQIISKTNNKQHAILQY